MTDPVLKHYITYTYRGYFSREPGPPETKEITPEQAANPKLLLHPAGIAHFEIWCRGELVTSFRGQMTTFVTIGKEVLHHS